MKTISLVVFFLLSSFATPANAYDCVSQLPHKKAPQYTQPAFNRESSMHCFQEFTVFWSGVTRVPLWVGEYLTPQRMQGSAQMKRMGEFHESDQPQNTRAWLSDYRRSGFDRGHMAPSADMSNMRSQQESFNLINIVPQNHEQNAGVWANIEHAVRGLARKEPVYVITGVLFEGAQVGFLQNRVGIPTHMYKLVYIPRTNQAKAYVVANHAQAKVEFMEVQALERRAMIRFHLPSPRSMHLPLR